MNSKQRAQLRGLAQTLSPIIQIGKSGLSEHLITEIENALEARELIKITLLDSIPEEKTELSEQIAKATHSEIVQITGKKLTLYRKSVNNSKIELAK